jgi:hypothetical protein
MGHMAIYTENRCTIVKFARCNIWRQYGRLPYRHENPVKLRMSRVIPYLVRDGLSILQYADDTILFMEHNFEQAKNMKLLLSDFEQLSRLKINFYKSDFFYFGEAKNCES